MSNLSPNYYPGRSHNGVTGSPQIIVLHMTEGEFSSAKGWLCNGVSEASATRLFRKSGESVELVAESDAPWTNGFAEDQNVPPTNPWVLKNCWNVVPRITPNLDALTIEAEWFEADGVIPVGSPLYLALVAQVATWCHKYGIPVIREQIMGHYEITPEEKPVCGKHIPWGEFMNDVMAQVSILQLAATYAAPVAAATDQTVSAWAAEAWAWAKDTGINDGANPKALVTEEQAMVFLHRFEEYLAAITAGVLQKQDDRITALENGVAATTIAFRTDSQSAYPGMPPLTNTQYGKLILPRDSEPTPAADPTPEKSPDKP